jgi:dTDP-4-dehydrorhamnose 3,5-epimerase
MEIKETSISGCYELFPRIFKDERGKLIKPFHEPTFKSLGLETVYEEEYYSISAKGVLRGLHFQLPPKAHVKCVTCVKGKIFDAVVDLRKGSPTYGKYFSTELDSEEGKMIYIPEGCAHGFYVLEDQSIFLNRSSKPFSADHDTGILWNSCGINWPNHQPILSEKDKNMIPFDAFDSPFNFHLASKEWSQMKG